MNTLTQEGQASNKSFRDIYMELPTAKERITAKQEFIKMIARITMKSEQTVKYWISETQQPDALAQSVIEKALKTPANVLFPKKECESCEQ